jgi:hypothetical protein
LRKDGVTCAIVDDNSSLFTPCGWVVRGRIWNPSELCLLENEIDMRTWRNLGTFPELNNNDSSVDLTVVTVVNLFESESGVFSILHLQDGSSLSNVLIVVDMTMDLTTNINQDIWVSMFDSVAGSMSNVTVVGKISI